MSEEVVEAENLHRFLTATNQAARKVKFSSLLNENLGAANSATLPGNRPAR